MDLGIDRLLDMHYSIVPLGGLVALPVSYDPPPLGRSFIE